MDDIQDTIQEFQKVSSTYRIAEERAPRKYENDDLSSSAMASYVNESSVFSDPHYDDAPMSGSDH